MTANPLLHWALDDIASGGIAVDSSPNHVNGTTSGTCAVQPDPAFGSCVTLDGKSGYVAATLTQESSLPQYTAQAWVNLAAPTAPTAVILDRAQGFGLTVDAKGTLAHTAPVASNATFSHASGPGALAFGAWHHVAVTNDGTTARVYVDAAQVAEAALPAAPAKTGGPFAVGHSGTRAPAAYLAGSLAHVRIYDGALGAAELRRDMDADQTLLAEFVRAHPLSFSLLNGDGQPVLYLDDAPTGQSLTLRLTNSARQDIALWASTDPVSARNHHLALQWRAGTIATASDPVVLKGDGWTVATSTDLATWYLLHADATTIGAGDWLDITLGGLFADATGGTHGTRVELDHQQLGYSGEPNEVVGSRQQAFEVVNQRGRPDIPLSVGFVGGDRMLNGGVGDAPLRLRVANVSWDVAIPFTGSLSSAAGGASALVVSVDVQASGKVQDWALATADQIHDGVVALTASTGGTWDLQAAVLTDRAEWTLTPQEDTELAAGGWLELSIGPMQALATPGQAPVVVAYRNLPGYADGVLTTAVQRSPLLFVGDRAGLGTAEPQAKLHILDANTDGTKGSLIVGPTNASNLRLGYNSTYSWVQSHGPAPLAINPVANNVGIGTTTPSARLQIVDANTDGTAQSVIIGPTSGSHLGLGYNTTYAYVQSQASLAINPLGGKVGIGTAAPQSRVQIIDSNTDPTVGTLILGPTNASNLRLGYNAGYSYVQSHGPAPLAINPVANNVGIGTAAPASRLQIVDANTDPNVGTLILGPTNASNLRLGYNSTYSYVQSHGSMPLAINPIGNNVGIGTVASPQNFRLTVAADSQHLQLHRDSQDGGSKLFLELYQSDTPAGVITYPAIRFHHSNKFWHIIEGRPEGFRFTDGNVGNEDLVGIAAASLTVGNTTIGEHELQVLLRLASGALEFDLLNVYQNEYAYAADYNPYDADRRYVWTWRHKGEQVSQGRWRIVNPNS